MVTREDVARLAGVSVSAVSRTINQRGYVAEEKRQKVIAAAQELGYRSAMVLPQEGRTRQLCFINTDIYNPFYMQLFQAMSVQARKKNYIIYLLHSFDAEIVKKMRMDGIVVESEMAALEVSRVVGDHFHIPIVSASYGLPEVKTRNIHYVDVDSYQAMEIALRYLKKLGHRWIAFASPYRVKNKENTVQSRYVAYENGMAELLQQNLEQYIFQPDAEEKEGRQCELFFYDGIRGAEEFKRRNCDATAIVCFNDQYALGMMQHLQQLGYRIPEDLSIMGIDGIMERRNRKPELTTIDMNITKLGETCVNHLIELAEGRKVRPLTLIKPHLSTGESVRSLEPLMGHR